MFAPKRLNGVAAWDTFMTFTETAKKLGVSFYDYVFDHISQAYRLPDLAQLIYQRTGHPIPTGASASFAPPTTY